MEMRDIGEFLLGLLRRWEAWVAVVALLPELYERVVGKPMHKWLHDKRYFFWFLVVSGFATASFFSWEEKNLRVKELQKSVKPDLVLTMEEVAVGRTRTEMDDPDSNVFIVAALANHGAPSIAEQWSLEVALPGEKPFQVPPLMMRKGARISFDDGASQRFTLAQDDSLYERALAQPLQQGAKIRGIIAFNIKDISSDRLQRAGTLYTLTCTDVFGAKSTSSLAFRGENSGFHMYPGFEHEERVTDYMPCVKYTIPL